MRDLTERQSEVFDYIHGKLAVKGLAPTVQEIQQEFGFGSPNAVQTHLNALEKKGFIHRLVGQARGLRLTNAGLERGPRSLNTSRIAPIEIEQDVTFSQLGGQVFGASSLEPEPNGQIAVLNDVQLMPEFSTPAVSQSVPKVSQQSKKILVIDDEADIRFIESTRLQRAGYATVVAADGLEGLRHFYDDEPDLVVLDIAMPEMDGWQVLERIREVSNIPVLMLTAAIEERDKVRGLKGGADDYITKPFSGEEFLARVEAALRRAAASSEIDDRQQTSGYDNNLHTPASDGAERFNKNRYFPTSNEFETEVSFHAKHSISSEFDGATHLHHWKLLTRVYIPDGLAGASWELQKIYIRRLVRELTDDLEGTVLNQLDSFMDLAPTPERIVTWLGYRAKQELEMVGVQLSSIALQELGVFGPGGTTQAENNPMLKIDFQDSGSIIPQVYEVEGSTSPNGVHTHLDALTEGESIEELGRTPPDIPVSDTEDSVDGLVENFINAAESAAGEDTQAATDDSGIAPPAQQSEMGLDVFFNAKHITANEFDGEIHAHSWRLRAVVDIADERDDPPVGFEKIRDALQGVVDEVEGVVLNGIEPFKVTEPTPERLVAWLSSKIRDKLNTLGVQLRSTTIWDHPTQYVTTWEQMDLHAV